MHYCDVRKAISLPMPVYTTWEKELREKYQKPLPSNAYGDLKLLALLLTRYENEYRKVPRKD